MRYLNDRALSDFDVAEFARRRPFPWMNPQDLLSNAGFEQLLDDFPKLALFERHQGLKRKGILRAHDRYYLQLGGSIYHRGRDGPGVVQIRQLPDSWQAFIDELTTNPAYRTFLKASMGSDSYRLYFSWHVGTRGSEVSPHVDASRKLGTHIFYFNTTQDWREEWGGSTLVLDDYPQDIAQPDFADFRTAQRSEITDNRSFLFRNRPGAWHGVKSLDCPEHGQRRLFNVVVLRTYPRHLFRKALSASRRLMPFRAHRSDRDS